MDVVPKKWRWITAYIVSQLWVASVYLFMLTEAWRNVTFYIAYFTGTNFATDGTLFWGIVALSYIITIAWLIYYINRYARNIKLFNPFVLPCGILLTPLPIFVAELILLRPWVFLRFAPTIMITVFYTFPFMVATATIAEIVSKKERKKAWKNNRTEVE